MSFPYFMIYPVDFESKIGFDAIRRAVIEKSVSRLAREEASKMSFSCDYEKILHQLNCVNEMCGIKTAGVPFPFPPAHDVLPSLSEIKAAHSFMSADKLFRLLQMLEAFDQLCVYFNTEDDDETYSGIILTHLKEEAAGLSGFPGLVRVISSAVNKFGEVKDNASPRLYEIRQSKMRASGSMQRALRGVLDRAVAAGIVEKDAAPAIRDGRLVIPVAAGKKRSLNGIVHDESATGKTVFIEPAEVVEAGNRIRELELEEKREITSILISIADEIRPFISQIGECCHIAAKYDFISAKADFALEVGATLPNIEDKPELEWYHACHPSLMISLRQHGREVVPLDLTLSYDNRILIISGPNAGGKSVCLKTVAVVQYMMQCGMLPTLHDNSHMGIFRNLFVDIGDEQSFENDLSTYSSHLRNMRVFLTRSDSRTLLMADEMGSGTEPQIGGAMAQAILQKLAGTGCYGIVTTHYQNLKTFAETTPGFVNGAMLYDRSRLEPTFQLSVGNPGSSFAIDIAHKMGLPSDVIEEAKNIVGSDYVNLDKYLSDIARDRRYWNSKRLNIREKENKLDRLLSEYETVAAELKSKRRQILDQAKSEAKEIVDGANARIEKTIREIRNIQAEKEKTKEIRKDLKSYADNSTAGKTDDGHVAGIRDLRHKSRQKKSVRQQPVSNEPKPFNPGDYVKIDGGTATGEIITVSGKRAEVAFGAMRTLVDVAKLKHTSKPSQSALAGRQSVSFKTSEESRRRQLSFSNEIDVRGMRADEALQAVTYFMDDAIQFSAGRVRILHGTGHGILKTLIRQMLKSIPGVKSFEDEDIRFGGAGITVVNLE